MKNSEIIKFFRWTRNGTCFAFTWLMLIVIIGLIFQQQVSLSTNYAARLWLLCLGGSLIFSFIFTKAFLRRPGFSQRLLLFFLVYGVYQSLGFWWLGILFQTLRDWLMYIGILLACYAVSQTGYQCYCRKYRKLYTDALNIYKEKNTSREN